METKIMSELEILNAALSVGFVKFSYYKKDGSHRIAIGTRNAALIEKMCGEKAGKYEREYAEHCIPYFDLSRGDFRCFIKWKFDRIELERLDKQDAVIGAMTLAYALKDVTPNEYINVGDVCIRLTNEDFVSSVCEKLRELCAPSKIDNDLVLVNELTRSVASQVRPRYSSDFAPSFAVTEQKVSGSVVEHGKTRKELIAELMELRKRESEILAELLQ